MTDQETRQVLGAAIARLDREIEEKEQVLQDRIAELENYTEWLHDKVVILYAIISGMIAFFLAECWFGKGWTAYVVASLASLILPVVAMEGWKPPFLFRNISKRTK